MKDLFEPPSTREDLGEAPRRSLPWISENTDSKSIQVGLIGTILLHIILLFILPRMARLGYFGREKTKTTYVKPKPKEIEIPLSAFLPPPPQPKSPPKFVEANPNAPENTPDHTDNFSDRNQQVAQEKPTPNGHNDHPALEGKKDFHSSQIVDGRLDKPQQEAPPITQPAAQPKAAQAATERREQNPLAGNEFKKADDKDGFGSNSGKIAENNSNVTEHIAGSKQGSLVQTPNAPAALIDPRHPQPRKTLAQHVRPAIFAENKIGTSNIGPIAVDAKWSNYGVYLQRMIETVQIEWERILIASKVYPNSGSYVQVKFIMNSKGEISKIISVDPTGAPSDAAIRACPSGITARSPYGQWTDDMIAVLGEKQEMTFVFYYE
ncbi:MAG: hypothetical protein WCO38_05570 [Verrucomicrobiota bacterium]|jgi:hypothetical protein|nr:MAG: hypothetical protein DVB35_02105 [Verrucomicrobiota bacterium]